MKLISWFIEPNSWEIIIDEEKLSKINLMSYYKEIWYLTQDPSVFDWTIIENLTYWAKEEVTENKLREIIKKAKCEFIYDFKNWLNTEIWERWVRLSGWQKQRLAIAKIFLKDPKIIFLDEPTSALDSKSEKLIHESFNELFKWKTIIIIAHRLQTVKSADEIFVIEKWKLIEKWNHKELLNKKWYYSQMIELQSGF
jgi:ABC-type multidrug transport system fused ATPase/permease subunit